MTGFGLEGFHQDIFKVMDTMTIAQTKPNASVVYDSDASRIHIIIMLPVVSFAV